MVMTIYTKLSSRPMAYPGQMQMPWLKNQVGILSRLILLQKMNMSIALSIMKGIGMALLVHGLEDTNLRERVNLTEAGDG